MESCFAPSGAACFRRECARGSASPTARWQIAFAMHVGRSVAHSSGQRLGCETRNRPIALKQGNTGAKAVADLNDQQDER